MAHAPLTEREYRAALQAVRRPSGAIRRFLRHHVRSPAGISDTVALQKAAGYKHHGGINLQYGLLAKRIARKCKYRVPTRDAALSVLVEFDAPLPRDHWKLTIYPEFARALVAEGWV